VDGPSGGGDILVQASYKPTKSWHLTSFYKNEMKTGNMEVLNTGTHGLSRPVKKRWRIDTHYTISRSVSFTSRMEFLWIVQSGSPARHGFLGMAGFIFMKSGFSGNMGTTVFETDDYDSRVYTYEPDLLNNFSLPAYYGKGLHYYINLHKDFSRLIPHAGKHFRLSGWFKWGQTFYPGSGSIGSGLDEVPGNRKSEIKIQVLVQWQ
jgi:hypothetical protein